MPRGPKPIHRMSERGTRLGSISRSTLDWTARVRRAPTAHIGLGLLIGQTLVYGSTPLITRLYTTSEVGLGGVFLAYAAVLGAVATLRFEVQLATASESECAWLIRTSLSSIIVVSLLGAMGYVWAVQGGTGLDGLLFGVSVAGLGGVALATQWSARQQVYSGVAASKLVQGGAQAFTQISAAAIGFTARGLQLGYAIGFLGSALTQAWPFRRHRDNVRLRPGILDSSRRRSLIQTSLVLVAATSVNMATLACYPIITRWLFGLGQAGELTVAQRFSVAPAGLAVATVAPVVLGAAGRELREGRTLWLVARRWTLRLLPVGVLAWVLLALAPAQFLVLALGRQWGDVSSYLKAMGPLIAAQVAVGPVSQLLTISGRSKTQLGWDVSRLVSVVSVSVATGKITGNPHTMIWAASAVLVLFYCVYMALLRFESRGSGNPGPGRTGRHKRS